MFILSLELNKSKSGLVFLAGNISVYCHLRWEKAANYQITEDETIKCLSNVWNNLNDSVVIKAVQNDFSF